MSQENPNFHALERRISDLEVELIDLRYENELQRQAIEELMRRLKAADEASFLADWRAYATEQQSTRSNVTGLLNLKGALKEYMSEIRHRINIKRATIVYMDLRGFKAINDKYGHSEGDKALNRVARALRNAFKIDDLVIHFSGDEFGIIAFDENDNMSVEDFEQVLLNRVKKIAEDFRVNPFIVNRDGKQHEVELGIWYGAYTVNVDEVKSQEQLAAAIKIADLDMSARSGKPTTGVRKQD